MATKKAIIAAVILNENGMSEAAFPLQHRVAPLL